MAEVKNLEGKEHELAELMWSIDNVDKLDSFATSFNNMYKIIRKHLLRIGEIKDGRYVIGKLHKDGFVIYSMEDGEN